MSEQLRKQVLDKLNYESLSPFDLDTSLTEGIDGSTAIVKDSFSEDQIKVFEKLGVNPTTFKSDQPNGVHDIENVLDLGGTLKKEDLKRPEYMQIIRKFMVNRQGARYNNTRINRISDEDVIEDYLEHMRFFSTNSLSTVGEMSWMRDADEQDKLSARNAYMLFDQLGNVFTTGTFGDKVDGVWDYINAQFRDPTNYIGLATGGVARVSAIGLSVAARAVVKKAAIDAGRSVMLRKGSKAAVAKAMREAGEKMTAKMSEQMAKSKHGQLLKSQAIRKAQAVETYKIKNVARDVYLRSLKTKAIRKSLYATGALDGILAVAQDAKYQQTLLGVEAQDEYSYLQSGSTFGLGIIGLGAQVGAGALRKKFGRKLEGELSDAEAKFMPEIVDGKVKSKIQPIIDPTDPKKQRIIGYEPIKGTRGGLETQKAVDAFVDKASVKTRSKIRNQEIFMSNPTHYLNSPSWKDIKGKAEKGLDTEIGKTLLEEINTWNKKTNGGKGLIGSDGKVISDSSAIHHDLLQTILRGQSETYDPTKGKDGVGGLMRVWLEHSGGVRLHKETRAAHFFTDMLQFTSDKQINQIHKALKKTNTEINIDTLSNPSRMELSADGKMLMPKQYAKGAAGTAARRRDNIGDLMSNQASTAGKTLAYFRHAKAGINAAITAAEIEMTQAVDTSIDNATGQTVLNYFSKDKEEKKANIAGYAINFWRRMLVSLPKTTAVNIKGFSYMYGSNSIAEVMSSGLYLAAAMLAPNAKTRKAMLHNSKVHFDIQAEKMSNLFDPYATVDETMAILEYSPEAKRKLTTTTVRGIDKKGTQYGIDPENKLFQTTEIIADASNKYSGVSLQDTVTKSLYFIPELDKYIRLKYPGKTLQDYLRKGNLHEIDQEAIEAAVDQTMKSVFSKDYTTEATIPVLRSIATFVERASNTPGVNFKIPFGRFLNNVVGAAYREGPAAILPAFGAIVRSDALTSPSVKGVTKGRINKIKNGFRATVIRANDTELAEDFATKKEASTWLKSQRGTTAIDQARLVNNFSRALVGTGAIAMGTRYAYTKPEELSTFEVEGPGGSVVDLENVYPFSLILAMGEFSKQAADGYLLQLEADKQAGREPTDIKEYWSTFKKRASSGTSNIDPELLIDMGKQVGVGQAARDAQFSTDIGRIVDTLIYDEDGNQLQKTLEVARILGGSVGGALRPLDSLNSIIGFATDTDASKDLRQAEGFVPMVTQSATKYVDNILEAVIQRLDFVLEDDELVDKYIVGKNVVSARRDGEVRNNANPYADVLGVKIKQESTATGELYSVLGMKDWSADQRSNLPSLDRAFNSILGPLLEEMSERLLSTRSFMDSDKLTRRARFKEGLKKLRAEVREELEAGLYESSDLEPIDLYSNQQRKKIMAASKIERRHAFNLARKRGDPTDPAKMNTAELRHILQDIATFRKDAKSYTFQDTKIK
tara:strand:- start:545 stop:4870 length:4326 start_codon:yes stop_codon:yes gene_type:complete